MIDEFDEAELRHDVRQIFNDEGFDGLMKTFDEVMFFSKVILEIAREEYEIARRERELGQSD